VPAQFILAENESGWTLLAFYASLFEFVHKAGYLPLNGTGSRGFSIRVNVQGKVFTPKLVHFMV